MNYDLSVLTRYSTPTVANAIELFEIRPRNVGYLPPGLQCLNPDAPPVAGFAATCAISSQSPDSAGRFESFDYWSHVESIHGPRISVVRDLDPSPSPGSFWGEVNASIHQALGCVGAVTDGGIRDTAEMKAIGFQALYRYRCVSHAYIHVANFGQPVNIHGVVIRPGDLLQMDSHGVLIVPLETLGDLEAAIEEIERRERPVITYAQSGTATRAGLVEAVTKNLRNHGPWKPARMS